MALIAMMASWGVGILTHWSRMTIFPLLSLQKYQAPCVLNVDLMAIAVIVLGLVVDLEVRSPISAFT
jgi:hypothetical protein